MCGLAGLGLDRLGLIMSSLGTKDGKTPCASCDWPFHNHNSAATFDL